MAEETITVDGDNVKVRELSIPADEGQLSRVRDFIAEVCSESGFSPREASNTKLAVDEACTNIIKHAYSGDTGEIIIRTRIGPGQVDISLVDQGKRFDFSSVQDPDLDQYVETGKKGGLGVFLINRLMDGVQYRATDGGNELVLTKRSHGALSRSLPGKINWKGSLRYKFTLRATLGLFVIIAAIWGYIFNRQSSAITTQHTSQWVEKKRLAENIANKSTDFLLNPEPFSIEQTTLTTFVTRIMDGNPDLAYARVVGRDGEILSSSKIDEIFSEFSLPAGTIEIGDADDVKWTQHALDDRVVRGIEVPVQVRNETTQQLQSVGNVHMGVFEDSLSDAVRDPRLLTTLIILACFLVGVFLIISLVSVFVKPIQVLTDGVRAIGQGSLDGQISVDGPAEIGAIAAVFNEITSKFKKAQENVLEQEKLQKEIEVAKQIQQALLPKTHPAVSGYDIAPYYQAAKEVGGDYYDFVAVDEDTLGVVVADVSGKGVPGSLVMTMIRTALRMEARGNKNASDVMTKMNDFVTDDMKKGMFVTMFYVILDSKNRIISYASAGHNPMILYRGETNETYFLNPKGFPVGISLPDESLFQRSISLEKIKLKKDDMLLIYTDGVTEAMNEKRDQYGEDRLISIVKRNGHLHPEEFIKRLEVDIKAFTGGYAQNDDITVVAVKEKLGADDVLSGIRKRLIDMVDVDGLSVKEACAKMKVSPATYYRYKKRLAVMGERGLRNKVLRQDTDIKRVSIEQRKGLMRIIAKHPEYGAKRITNEFNEGEDSARKLSEKMVYDELKRLNLNTRELRIDYLKRNHLMPEESLRDIGVTDVDLVAGLIDEVANEPAPPAPTDQDSAEEHVAIDSTAYGDDEPGEVAVNVVEAGEDVTVLEIDGHLDSVSSSTLERLLQDVISQARLKIAVDLSKVSYISSGGWGIFVGEVRRLREQGGDVVLVGMLSEVYDVYELLGFNDLLKAFPTLEDAKSYFRKSAEDRFSEPTQSTAGAPVSLHTSLVDQFDDSEFGPDWESLTIEATTVGDRGDIAVVSLDGIIDTISAENLRAAIDKVIRADIRNIVVDMSQVEYVSSGGWGTFTERLRELRRSGGDLKLFGMDPDVYYVFTMLGFNIVLASFDIMADAIEDFGKDPADRPSKPPTLQVVSSEKRLGEDEPEVDGPVLERSRTKPIEWRDADDILIAKLFGTLEATSVGTMDQEISTRLEVKPPLLLFDMSEVSFVSSTGWGLFAKYHERAVLWGGKIALCGMSQGLTDIFGLLEFQTFIDVYLDRKEALTRFRAGEPGALLGSDVLTSDSDDIVDVIEEDNSQMLDEILDAPDTPLDPKRSNWPDEGAQESEPHVVGEAPAAPEVEWPAVPDKADEDAHEEVKSSESEPFIDLGDRPHDVDIEAADEPDDSKGGDPLDGLGWERYGKRLTGRKEHQTKDGDDKSKKNNGDS